VQISPVQLQPQRFSMRRSYKTTAVLAVVTSLVVCESVLAHSEHNEEPVWEYTVGAGFLHVPNYLGDDASQVILAPSIKATDGAHWSIGFIEGIQYTFNPEQSWQWGLAVAPFLGRDTDGSNPLRVAGKNTDDLIGLGKTDTAVTLRAFTQTKVGAWSFNARLQQTYTNDVQTRASVGVRRSAVVSTKGPPLITSIGVRLRLGDQATMESLVGVTAEQSAISGLDSYRPDSGIVAVGLNGVVILPLSRSLSVLSTFSVEHLGDELTDSSLVDTRGNELQTSVGLFISYKLGQKQSR